jgi:hypothetical protein
VADDGIGWIRPPFSKEALKEAEKLGIDLNDETVQAQLREVHEFKGKGERQSAPLHIAATTCVVASSRGCARTCLTAQCVDRDLIVSSGHDHGTLLRDLGNNITQIPPGSRTQLLKNVVLTSPSALYPSTRESCSMAWRR